MKKKFLKETYLREVTDYKVNVTKNEKLNSYTVIKHIINTEEPYISNHTGENICLIDNGYYIVEEVPMDEKYLVRAFFDNEKKLKGYYIDIVKENNIEDNMLYYLDLYVDITVDKVSNGEELVMVWDSNELKEALEKKAITLEEYYLAHRVLKDIFNEIANKENIYMKKCLEDIKSAEI